MKSSYLLIIFLPFMLWLAGCEQTRPGVIKNLIFYEGDQWLERDVQEDPYELVGGQCCNDYYPYPLQIDTSLHAVINPADDLDYFNIQITDGYAGRLVLTPEDEDITFRIFNRTLNDEYNALVDTFYTDYWTVLYGPSATFTVLVAGGKGDYNLSWNGVILEDGLKIIYPKAGYRWRRSNSETISWATVQSEPVTAALLKGPVIVRFLKSGSDAIYDDEQAQLDWRIPDDIEVSTGYRIMIYSTANPEKMNISDAFEIY